MVRKGYLQAPGLSPGNFCIWGGKSLLELSIFADESGDKSDHAKYYLLTLVFHNQADSIIDQVMTYERSLADADLPNIAFHSEPLMNGHKDYEQK